MTTTPEYIKNLVAARHELAKQVETLTAQNTYIHAGYVSMLSGATTILAQIDGIITGYGERNHVDTD